MGARARIGRLAVAAGILMGANAGWAASGSAAERALMEGRVDEAVGMLKSMIAAKPQEGRNHLLLCRAYYAEEMVDAAIPECETATQQLPQSSEAQDWMGRVYGVKAAHAGWYNGMKMVGRVRDAFEAAVRLDPRSSEAVNDLGEFYIGAPGIVGGGVDKAEALADRVQPTLPQAAHRIRGLAAEHKGDFATAEKEFREAVDVAGAPEAWSDLAQYFARRHDGNRSVEAAMHALSADKANDFVLEDVASVLTELHRETPTAEKALRTYLERGTKSDAAPAFRVHVELGKLLLARGDKAGAKIEFNQSLQMAAGYAPARKAIQGL